MQIELVFAESAVSDLEDILAYYFDQDILDVGEDVVAKILGRIEGLGVHPESGRIVPEFGQQFLREIIYPPFRIVYKIGAYSKNKPHKIEVVRVWRIERLMELPE